MLQSLMIYWGGGKAKPDTPGSAGTAASPQSWGNFGSCANINGQVPRGWTPYFAQTSIVVLRSVGPDYSHWQLHGVIANASDCAFAFV